MKIFHICKRGRMIKRLKTTGIDEFPEDVDVDDTILIQPMITHRVARQCVQTLQRYFLEQGESLTQLILLWMYAQRKFSIFWQARSRLRLMLLPYQIYRYVLYSVHT